MNSLEEQKLSLSETKKSNGTKSERSAARNFFSNSDLLSALGSAKTMPSPVQAKMEKSFGADLSDVLLYESPVVSENGAEAVARGSKIAFAPGKMDFNSFVGQELLGHELSHVVSQKMGVARGSGFLNNSSLERRADNEGARAAKGISAFDSIGEQYISPMSDGLSQSSAPMQAKKKELDYIPSAKEQLGDRMSNDSTSKYNALSEIAMHRYLLSHKKDQESLSDDEEEAYQKEISGLSKNELSELLSEHSKFSGSLADQYKTLHETNYYMAAGQKNSENVDLDAYADGMSNYILSNNHQGFSFKSYEKLLGDIKSNPKSKSAKALNSLTGEGGEFESMEDVDFMRDAFSMDDDFIDRSTGQLAHMHGRDVMQKRKQSYGDELGTLDSTRKHYKSSKKKEWWQFWK